MRTHYYREHDGGDYLVVFPTLFRDDEYGRLYDGRATAIQGLPASVCTTGISARYLADCTRVCRGQVPRRWLKALVG